ncbi:hypothetical protein GOP47_0012171 [Adiantum capillus-veneris]|uniref:Pentatricopeptide repeat-containing protein n=1 Tax=Adiantum capillus-veneris TaxID=13818 RepID=A0A9D4UQI3_ADICA|nr:hypothetical protein GOP47_0012171 [Adiantum capillus-veneris]
MCCHVAPLTIESAHGLLKRYIDAKDLVAGRRLYALIEKSGLQTNLFLGSYFIRLFSLSDNVSEAYLVFRKLIEPNVFNWTAIISAFNLHGQSERAIEMHHLMQQANVPLDEYVFVALLHSCAVTSSLIQGKQLHVQINGQAARFDTFVGNSLIDMYAKCGGLEVARKVFLWLRKRDMSSRVTLVSTLKACASIEFLEDGRLIHAQAIEEGFDSGVIFGSAVTNLYAKCGKLLDACCVLEKQPSRHTGIWNALVTGYAQNGDGEKALQVFQKMRHDGFMPNEVTFVCIVKACTGMCAFDDGRHIHALIVDNDMEENSFIQSSLIDMYTASGSLDDARRVFDRVSNRDEITWGAIVTGYTEHGCGEEALLLFEQMQTEGAKFDVFTLVNVLKACTCIVALDVGQLIHGLVIEHGLESDVCLGSALIDFYSKCGSLDDAASVFNHLPKQNIVTWSAMIGGYSLHGNIKAALQFFEHMKKQGLKADDVVFVSLLSTCAQMGLVDEGKQLFEAMTKDFGLAPTGEHYNCMVDLLGRVGHFGEAESLMEFSPEESSFVGWLTLLSHCKAHNRVTMARRCFDHIVALDSGHASAYVLMSEIYDAAGMHDDAEKIRKMRDCGQAWKKPGRASIEINKKLHTFVVGDQSHSQILDIHLKLNCLNSYLIGGGHVPHAASISAYGKSKSRISRDNIFLEGTRAI